MQLRIRDDRSATSRRYSISIVPILPPKATAIRQNREIGSLVRIVLYLQAGTELHTLEVGEEVIILRVERLRQRRDTAPIRRGDQAPRVAARALLARLRHHEQGVEAIDDARPVVHQVRQLVGVVARVVELGLSGTPLRVHPARVVPQGADRLVRGVEEGGAERARAGRLDPRPAPVLDVDALLRVALVRARAVVPRWVVPLGEEAASVEELGPVFLRDAGDVQEGGREVEVQTGDRRAHICGDAWPADDEWEVRVFVPEERLPRWCSVLA